MSTLSTVSTSCTYIFLESGTLEGMMSSGLALAAELGSIDWIILERAVDPWFHVRIDPSCIEGSVLSGPVLADWSRITSAVASS